MAEDTKSVNLTKDEIQTMIEHHGIHISADNAHDRVERINYLYKRLKAFNEAPENAPVEAQASAPIPAAPASIGWGNN